MLKSGHRSTGLMNKYNRVDHTLGIRMHLILQEPDNPEQP